MDYVKKANGTSRRSNPSTDGKAWLAFWEQKTGKKDIRCGAEANHSTTTLVGAHVKKVFGGDGLHITPLCSYCNQRTDNFWVDTELARIPNGFKNINGVRPLKCFVAESEDNRKVKDISPSEY